MSEAVEVVDGYTSRLLYIFALVLDIINLFVCTAILGVFSKRCSKENVSSRAGIDTTCMHQNTSPPGFCPTFLDCRWIS